MSSRDPVAAAEQDSSVPQGRQIHRRRKRGYWYFVIPVLSLGLLSAIPFLHAWWKLRERRIAILAVLYSAAGVVAFTIPTLAQSKESSQWLQRLEVPGYTVGWIAMVFACLQLRALRRRVYHEIDKPVPATPDRKPKAGSKKPKAESRAEDLAFLLISVPMACIGLTIYPALMVRYTLATPGTSFFPFVDLDSQPLVTLLALIAIASAPLAVVFAAMLDDTNESPGWLAAAILFTLVSNLYVGFAVWVAGAEWIGLPLAASGRESFGQLVWWNLIDSIPLVDVDEALDWEKPVNEYSASVGWLLVFQRIVVLLSLARAIQLAVTHRWRPPNNDAT